MDMLIWKGKISWGPIPGKRTTVISGKLAVDKIVFPRGESPSPTDYLVPSGQP